MILSTVIIGIITASIFLGIVVGAGIGLWKYFFKKPYVAMQQTAAGASPDEPVIAPAPTVAEQSRVALEIVSPEQRRIDRKFKPIWYFVMFVGDYAKVKSLFEEMFIALHINNPAVKYDDAKGIITVGYSKNELLKLEKMANMPAENNKYLSLFYNNHRNRDVFGGYISEYGCTASRPDSFEKEYEELCAHADGFFKNSAPFKKRQFDCSAVASTKNPFDLLQIPGVEGFCLGEDHKDVSPKKFLIENMAYFKRQGGNVIYLEHILSDIQQDELDNYLLDPNQTDMSPALKGYLQAIDVGHMRDKTPGYLDVVHAAKKHGIRIVAIDTEASYTTWSSNLYSGGEVSRRMKNMNYLAFNKITSEEEIQKRHGGKWIAFIGSGHAGIDPDGVPGLASMLNVPSLVIQDAKEKGEFTVEQNVKIVNMMFDMVVTVDPSMDLSVDNRQQLEMPHTVN